MKRPKWLVKHRKKVLTTYLVLAVIAALASPFPAFVLEHWPLQWADFTGIGWDSTTEKTIERDAQGNLSKEVTKTTVNSGKKLWDWLSLLGVPLSLALLGFWFQSKQQQRAEEQKAIEQKRTEEQRAIEQKRAVEQALLEREIAAENRREEALQTYFDRISTLLIEKNLLAIASCVRNGLVQDKELLDVSVDVIRARTLSILRRLEDDQERKTSVIRFLLEAELISKIELDLSNANLSNADLNYADLSNANLSNADLSNATLFGTKFNGAKLIGATLFGAKLIATQFIGAKLYGADLSNADLSNAKLSDADLNSAKLIGAKLIGAKLNDSQLINVKLIGADLRGTNLSNADLSNATLFGAKIIGAKLIGAVLIGTNLSSSIILATNLTTVEGLTKEQLEGDNAPFLCNVVLPEGIGINSNRDCDRLLLLQVLLEQYPEKFKTLEDAKAYIDHEVRQKKWDYVV